MPASNGLQKVTGIVLIVMGASVYAFALVAGVPIYAGVLSAVIDIAWGLRGERLDMQLIAWIFVFFLSIFRLFYVAISAMAFLFTVLGAGLAFTAGVISFSCCSDKKVELVLGGISILALPTAVACMDMINSRYRLDSLAFTPYMSVMDILIIVSIITPVLFFIGTIAKKEANK